MAARMHQATSAAAPQPAANGNIVLRNLEINPIHYIEKLEKFDGRTEDLAIFIQNVDDIIPTLLTYDEQGKKMCINLLKSKFIGRARLAIEIHTHLTTWSEIKNMLIENFGGFKNSDQLYEELRSAQYRGDVIKFYNYIQRSLSLLNQKCLQENNLLDIPRNTETGLKIFKERLSIHMRTILYSINPSTIEQALHELSNAGFLGKSENIYTEKINKQNPNPHKMFKNPNNPFRDNPQNRNNQIWHPKPYIPKNNNFQNNNYNPNNYRQFPQKFEPMEQDPTSSQLRRAPKATNYVEEYNKETGSEANFRPSASETPDYPILN